MPGRSSAERRAFEAVESAVMGGFETAGFDHIAPDILQPADTFLERSGEDIRAHAYVFLDPSGAELCLRPDLTVPTCRYHLTHAADPAQEARYCYRGPAFRFTGDTAQPSEIRQTGIEWLGGGDAQARDAAILATAVRALDAAGLRHLRVKTGDLALFRALIDDFDIPERWRRRLKHHFWRPQAFRDVLDVVSGDAIRLRSSVSAHVDAIAGHDAEAALAWVERRLSQENLLPAGGRSPAEIAARLAEKLADRSERPLARAEARRIADYLAIQCPAPQAPQAFAALGHGRRFDAAARQFERRDILLREAGLETDGFRFEATFGRSLEYYTGFVFQIEADTPHGPVQVAGGGRYDDLLDDIGAPAPVPAVGCAIYTEALCRALP